MTDYKWLDDPTLDVEKRDGIIGWEDEEGNIFVCTEDAKLASWWIGDFFIDLYGGIRGTYDPDEDSLSFNYVKPVGETIVPCSKEDPQALPIYGFGVEYP